jgi:ATP-dependent RNA helicase DeaD
MPSAIASIAARHLTDPVRVEVTRQASTAPTVEQTFAVVPAAHKATALARVLATTDALATIVFTRTRQAADEVGAALMARGLRAATISGDVAQRDREEIVERLRGGALDVLVATDVAARGLDVDRVGLVVNYDVPTEPGGYVHRVGRTGRAGRSGLSLTFVTPDEEPRLRAIERLTRQQMTEVTVPSAAEVAALRVSALLARAPGRLAVGGLEPYREAIHAAIGAGLDPVDAAVALAAIATEAGSPAEDARAIAPTPAQAARGAVLRDGRISFTGRRRARPDAPAVGGGTRYRVEVGRNHGVGPGHIVGALTGEGGLAGTQVGRVHVFASFSLVDLQTELGPEAYRRIGAAMVSGRRLRITPDRGPSGRSAAGRTAHPGTQHHRAARRG